MKKVKARKFNNEVASSAESLQSPTEVARPKKATNIKKVKGFSQRSYNKAKKKVFNLK